MVKQVRKPLRFPIFLKQLLRTTVLLLLLNLQFLCKFPLFLGGKTGSMNNNIITFIFPAIFYQKCKNDVYFSFII